MAKKQAQILNLDDILAQESQRTVVWKGTDYSLAGVTGETYLRFLSKQAQINKAMESGDLETQWQMSMEMLKMLAPSLPVEELQQLPWNAFQQVVNFVMATFQEEAGTAEDPSAGSGRSDGQPTTDGVESGE